MKEVLDELYKKGYGIVVILLNLEEYIWVFLYKNGIENI